jgi:hypothetical protein
MHTMLRPVLTVPGYRLASGLVRFAGLALFFLMLFVPTTYQSLKGALLVVVLGGITAAAVMRDRVRVHAHVLLAALGYSALGAFFVLRGYLAGAPGALSVINVYVTWPLVYTVLVIGASSRAMLIDLVRVIVTAANVVAVYSVIYVLWEAGYWPDALYVAIDQGQAIGFYGSYIEFNLYSISSLLFITPFLVAALVLFHGDQAPVTRRTLWITLALNVATVLLTGRRALFVLVPLAPVLALLLRTWLTAARKRESRPLVVRAMFGALALALILAGLATALGALAPGGFVNMVGAGFQFNTDPVAMSRRDQFRALVDGWSAQPILGSGHGAPAPGVIRSPSTPWAYELSYLSLLYHTGLVGVTAYALGLAWILRMSYVIARAGWPLSPSLVATLVGSSAFLIANATNPYLEKYDYLWVIFLPVAFINCYLTEGRNDAGGA